MRLMPMGGPATDHWLPDARRFIRPEAVEVWRTVLPDGGRTGLPHRPTALGGRTQGRGTAWMRSPLPRAMRTGGASSAPGAGRGGAADRSRAVSREVGNMGWPSGEANGSVSRIPCRGGRRGNKLVTAGQSVL